MSTVLLKELSSEMNPAKLLEGGLLPGVTRAHLNGVVQRVRPVTVRFAEQQVRLFRYFERKKDTVPKIGKKLCLERKLRGYSPNFYIDISVSGLDIPRIGLPIWLQQNSLT